jgi:hypothetical protein
LILLPFLPAILHAVPVKIDFEDKAVGSHIDNEYFAAFGVEFNSARICQPAKGTASGSQALTHATSKMEFSSGPLKIYFKGPQSRVKLAAGLNGEPVSALSVKMEAFDENGQSLKDIPPTTIGPGSTKISKILEIKINQKKIHEVRLTYGMGYFEVIDDLEFDDPVVAPPDNTPPVVNITTPLDQQIFHSAFFELNGTVQESEGLLNVKASIQPLNQSPDVIELSSLDIDYSSSPIKFHVLGLGLLSPGENKVTVTATDIGKNVGKDDVTVYYFPAASGLRKLGAYSLYQYEKNWEGKDWKDSIYADPSDDPYEDFWNFMVAGSGAYSVDKGSSERFKNQEVTIKTVIPIPGDNLKSWDDFDMVFFYGHNNTIPPPDYDFACYVNKQGNWKEEKTCYHWGSPGMPFDYYASGSIKNSATFPGAVTYLYHTCTASLLGDPYDYGGGEPEGSPQFWKVHWNDTPQQIQYGKLGAQNLKWLILHGCQAVVTADSDGKYSSVAYKALSEVHGGYHIILGHYKSRYVTQLQPLKPFGFDLICGVPVQTAYFDADPIYYTSAIAAEQTPFYWATSTMVNDTWLSPMSLPSATNAFSQRWIVSSKIIEKSP